MKEMFYEDIKRFKQALNEMEEQQEESTNAVPYTNQDEILGQYMDSARQQFGANFTNTKHPMMYIPSDGNNSENVIFTGEIGRQLNNAKFEMELNGEKSGCRIYATTINLTKECVELLKVVNGFYEVWSKEIGEMADKKPMSIKGNEDSEQTNENSGMVPGDDFGSRN